MLKVMAKPEHPFIKALAIAGMAASVFAIIGSIDIIINWF
jgi:hypothetical protein